MLKDRRIVIGISGGIAVYKICELTRLLKKQGALVRVVMTENAAKFVTPQTFETLSGNPVCTDTFAHSYDINHISLAKFAEITVVAPATANILAKMRAGIADDLLSTSLCAMTGPILVAPAMNTAMWNNPANQDNVQVLRQRGIRFVGPESGSLACGDTDVGRMSEPQDIVKAIEQILEPRRDLEGKRVLVTAGPTREMLDPVRFLTNRSTGRMGYAVAEAARDRGAVVTLVSGPVNLPSPDGVEVRQVISTADMFREVTSLAPDCDAVIQAAAPADFTVENPATQKIKKTGEGMTLNLVSTPDIARTIGAAKRPGQVFVAFAAETDATVEQADEKRRRKNADIIVLNDVTRPGAGFGTDTNIVTIITDAGHTDYPVMSKRAVADLILDEVIKGTKCDSQK